LAIFINRGTPNIAVNDIEFLSPNIFAAVDVPEWKSVYRFDDPIWTLLNNAGKKSQRLIVYGGELYQGTYGSVSGDARVYKYNVSGNSWSQIGGNLPDRAVYSMVEFDGTIFAGIAWLSGKVYRLNAGPVWTDVGRLGTEVSIISLVVVNSVLYGSGHTGKVYRYDGGTNWTAISATTYVGHALIDFNSELYSASRSGGLSVVKKYTGSGTDWVQIGSSLENFWNIYPITAAYRDKLCTSVGISISETKIYRYDTDWVHVDTFDNDVQVLKVKNDILWAGLTDGSIWSCYIESLEEEPTNEELMRHGKWFRNGIFKGYWLKPLEGV